MLKFYLPGLIRLISGLVFFTPAYLRIFLKKKGIVPPYFFLFSSEKSREKWGVTTVSVKKIAVKNDFLVTIFKKNGQKLTIPFFGHQLVLYNLN